MSTTDSETVAALARERLQTLTDDPEAQFREGQLEAIRDVVVDKARVLCVQRTGWGKSAVYFIATALLRRNGAGPTLIVSPLLALMRNQIAAAERPRAPQHPPLPRRDAAAVRRLRRPARDRRGALYIRLGSRLQARLPAREGHA